MATPALPVQFRRRACVACGRRVAWPDDETEQPQCVTCWDAEADAMVVAPKPRHKCDYPFRRYVTDAERKEAIRRSKREHMRRVRVERKARFGYVW